MKKTFILIATALMLAGIVLFIGLLIVMKFDFSKMNTVKYVTNNYDISEGFDSICIDTITSDIEIRPSTDGKCKVVCFETEKYFHDVKIQDGALVIQSEDDRKWYDQILVINTKSPKVTIYLPEGEYHSIKADNTTGDISVSGSWIVDSASLSTTTGDIRLSGMDFPSKLNVHVTTGDVMMERLTCGELRAEGSTGDVMLNNVMVSTTMQVKRTTGDINLVQCDASEINLKSTTGDISATLLSKKWVSAETTTGDVDVPSGNEGGRCEAITTTGDISIKTP